MLETARHCFTSAARCEGDGDEEEWLIHYMLGKVAEKQQQPPTVYLLHYRQAGHYLHEEAARYPKKIHYHNPPELAMEALEVTLQVQSRMLGQECLPALSPEAGAHSPSDSLASPLVTRLCSAASSSPRRKQPALYFPKSACRPFGENDHVVFLSQRKQPSSAACLFSQILQCCIYSHTAIQTCCLVCCVPRCR